MLIDVGKDDSRALGIDALRLLRTPRNCSLVLRVHHGYDENLAGFVATFIGQHVSFHVERLVKHVPPTSVPDINETIET